MDWTGLEFRAAGIFVLAGFLGGQINRGIYGLAWTSRAYSPWAKPPEGVPPRRWADCLPIVGWWSLRRESQWHGPQHWVRPMLIELAFAVGLTWLYVWEMHAGLWPLATAELSIGVLHAQFLAHVTLISLMVVATFIDFDEDNH